MAVLTGRDLCLGEGQLYKMANTGRALAFITTDCGCDVCDQLLQAPAMTSLPGWTVAKCTCLKL